MQENNTEIKNTPDDIKFVQLFETADGKDEFGIVCSSVDGTPKCTPKDVKHAIKEQKIKEKFDIDALANSVNTHPATIYSLSKFQQAKKPAGRPPVAVPHRNIISGSVSSAAMVEAPKQAPAQPLEQPILPASKEVVEKYTPDAALLPPVQAKQDAGENVDKTGYIALAAASIHAAERARRYGISSPNNTSDAALRSFFTHYCADNGIEFEDADVQRFLKDFNSYTPEMMYPSRYNFPTITEKNAKGEISTEYVDPRPVQMKLSTPATTAYWSGMSKPVSALDRSRTREADFSLAADFYKDPVNNMNTTLQKDEEKEFKKWFKQMKDDGVIPESDNGFNYDYRGAFKDKVKPTKMADGTYHWSDTYKKPNHPTFSAESKYATGLWGAYAGKWEGENFVAPNLTYPRSEQEKFYGLMQQHEEASKETSNPVQNFINRLHKAEIETITGINTAFADLKEKVGFFKSEDLRLAYQPDGTTTDLGGAADMSRRVEHPPKRTNVFEITRDRKLNWLYSILPWLRNMTPTGQPLTKDDLDGLDKLGSEKFVEKVAENPQLQNYVLTNSRDLPSGYFIQGDKTSGVTWEEVGKAVATDYYAEPTPQMPNLIDETDKVSLTENLIENKRVLYGYASYIATEGIPASSKTQGYYDMHTNSSLQNLEDYKVKLANDTLNRGTTPVATFSTHEAEHYINQLLPTDAQVNTADDAVFSSTAVPRDMENTLKSVRANNSRQSFSKALNDITVYERGIGDIAVSKDASLSYDKYFNNSSHKLTKQEFTTALGLYSLADDELAASLRDMFSIQRRQSFDDTKLDKKVITAIDAEFLKLEDWLNSVYGPNIGDFLANTKSIAKKIALNKRAATEQDGSMYAKQVVDAVMNNTISVKAPWWNGGKYKNVRFDKAGAAMLGFDTEEKVTSAVKSFEGLAALAATQERVVVLDQTLLDKITASERTVLNAGISTQDYERLLQEVSDAVTINARTYKRSKSKIMLSASGTDLFVMAKDKRNKPVQLGIVTLAEAPNGRQYLKVQPFVVSLRDIEASQKLNEKAMRDMYNKYDENLFPVNQPEGEGKINVYSYSELQMGSAYNLADELAQKEYDLILEKEGAEVETIVGKLLPTTRFSTIDKAKEKSRETATDKQKALARKYLQEYYNGLVDVKARIQAAPYNTIFANDELIEQEYRTQLRNYAYQNLSAEEAKTFTVKEFTTPDYNLVSPFGYFAKEQLYSNIIAPVGSGLVKLLSPLAMQYQEAKDKAKTKSEKLLEETGGEQ